MLGHRMQGIWPDVYIGEPGVELFSENEFGLENHAWNLKNNLFGGKKQLPDLKFIQIASLIDQNQNQNVKMEH